MFTGLVQRIGTLHRHARPNGGAALSVALAEPWPEPLQLGESIAVQGACLTVGAVLAGGGFSADVLAETLDRTAFGSLPDGARVNLERALRVGDRLGGHIVQGHVDAVGRVLSLRPREHDLVMRVGASADTLRGIVPKGSIAIDGVSLTVSALSDADGWFEVNLIPTTLRETSLRDRAPRDAVNLETDVLGKYVERMLGNGAARPAATPSAAALLAAGL